jgi:hypothetical protein
MFPTLPAPDFTASDLDHIVRLMLDDETARALEWRAERLEYRVWCRASGGVFRVHGQAATDRGRRGGRSC